MPKGHGTQDKVSVAPAGDVNGDGIDDLLVGVPGGYVNDRLNPEGKVYLVFGKEDGWEKEASLATADVTFIGERQGDFAGYSMATAGDVNGDGFDDILIGALGYDGEDENVGKVYLILGRPVSAQWPSQVNLAQADAGFSGESDKSVAGSAVASVGDINQDGLSDFIIGARGYDNGRGKVYVVYGKTNGWTHSKLPLQSGLTIIGESEGDRFGSSLASAGDFNGDGIPDIIVGAKDYDQGDTDVGKVYLFSSLESGTIHVDKMKLKAGKSRSANKDAFKVSGYLGAFEDDLLASETVFVQVGSFEQTFDSDRFKYSHKKQKYVYKDRPGGVTLFVLDFNNQTFLLKGSRLILSGTQTPVKVNISFGPFDGMDWAHDIAASEVLNGKDEMPLQFLAGHQDAIYVKKHFLKIKKPDTPSNVLYIKGNITFADTQSDLSNMPLEVQFGDFALVVLPENITKVKNKYIIKQSGQTDRVMGVIDINKAKFKIHLSKVDIGEQGGPGTSVLFALRWSERLFEDTIDNVVYK